MDDDTISRQAAIDEIDEWIKAFLEIGHKESAADARLIQDGIIQLPSAQPQRMRGRWIPDNLAGGGYWVCTACKHPTEAFAANVIYNFCPFCGAKMEMVEK